jgi:hypothetical protein
MGVRTRFVFIFAIIMATAIIDEISENPPLRLFGKRAEIMGIALHRIATDVHQRTSSRT